MGFDTERNRHQNEVPLSELLRETQPEDLVHFGMIPEFIGRLPMVAVLDELSFAAGCTAADSVPPLLDFCDYPYPSAYASGRGLWDPIRVIASM